MTVLAALPEVVTAVMAPDCLGGFVRYDLPERGDFQAMPRKSEEIAGDELSSFFEQGTLSICAPKKRHTLNNYGESPSILSGK
jgi:hypothetical protein